MEPEPEVCLLYCENVELRDRIERVLGGAPVRRVRSRKALLAPPRSVRATIVGITACSDGETEWLRSPPGHRSPPCVVVAHLTVDCLRRLYPLRSGRLRLVWADEVESRLVEVLDGFRGSHRGPMWRLGWKLLSDGSLRPPLRKTIVRVCGLDDDAARAPFIPETSVHRLAGRVGLAATTLRQYWRKEVPLRCSLKEFLSWAVLLWCARARSRGGWNAIADQVGLQRRTLQRTFIRLAGCRLGDVAEDPERVVRRFDEWVDSVWDRPSADGPGKQDRVRARTPLEQVT